MFEQEQIDRIHKWQRIWGDNTDLNNNEKGIIGFSRTVFPEHIKPEYSVSEIHKHMYTDALNLYSPELRFLTERQEQLIVFRGAAKSTTMLGVFLAYVMCFNGLPIILPNDERITIMEDVIAVCSETNTFATNWTRRARGALAKKWIKNVFGHMKDAALADEDGKWQEGCFKVQKDKLPYPYTGKNVAIISRGVGQQIRGINIDGRITLALIDDIYSKNNITTPESRQKVKYWFDAETKNSIDKNAGKIISIGTVVHEDTVVVENKASRFWKNVEYPVMDMERFSEFLDKHCQVDLDARTVIIPNSGECEQLEKEGWVTNWPEKFPLEMLLLMFAEAVEGRESKTLTMFYQEYFHQTIAESDKKIRLDMMKIDDFEVKSTTINGSQYTFVKMTNGEYRHVNTCISVDQAWSYKLTADDAAIGWIGMDYQARIYVISSISGKFGINDEFKIDTDYYTYASTLCTDTIKIQRIGTSDEVFRMATGHRPMLVIEVNTGAVEVARQIYRKMTLYGRRFVVIEVPQVKDKAQRILDVMMPYYQSRSVYHRPGQIKLMKQLELIQSTKHDDEADMLATGVAHLQKPTSLIKWVEPGELQPNKPRKWKVLDIIKGGYGSEAQSEWKKY